MALHVFENEPVGMKPLLRDRGFPSDDREKVRPWMIACPVTIRLARLCLGLCGMLGGLGSKRRTPPSMLASTSQPLA